MNTIVRTLLILIDFDASNKTPTTIFEYELPVMQKMHNNLGDDTIQVLQEGQCDIGETSVSMVFEGLRNKYGGKGARQHFDAVYPDERSFRQNFRRAIVDSVAEPASADTSAADELEAKRAALAEQQAELERQRAELEAARADLEAQRKAAASTPAPAPAPAPETAPKAADKQK